MATSISDRDILQQKPIYSLTFYGVMSRLPEQTTEIDNYPRSLRLRHTQTRKVKKSQYATKRMRTQRINPSIPIPSIVKHACITAIIAAAVASALDVGERRLACGSFAGFSFMSSHLLKGRF